MKSQRMQNLLVLLACLCICTIKLPPVPARKVAPPPVVAPAHPHPTIPRRPRARPSRTRQPFIPPAPPAPPVEQYPWALDVVVRQRAATLEPGKVHIEGVESIEVRNEQRHSPAPYLNGSRAYDTSDGPDKAREFSIASDGVVVLGAPDLYKRQVNEPPYVPGVTVQDDALIADGWIYFDDVVPGSGSGCCAYYRVCSAGEKFKYHFGPGGSAWVIEPVTSALPEILANGEWYLAGAPNPENQILGDGRISPQDNWLYSEIVDLPQTVNVQHFASVFEIELVRQALLIAARDEMGVTAMDRMLNDFPKQDAYDQSVNIFTKKRYHRDRLTVGVWERVRGTKRLLWRTAYIPSKNTPEMDLPALVEWCEEQSRSEFVTLLTNLKFTGKPWKTSSGPADPQAVALTWKLNDRAVAIALRKLHAQIRTEGESPERLAALARGYAMLGSLTDRLFCRMHVTLKARALLYAQRLVQRTGNSVDAQATQVFVQALSGLHSAALTSATAVRHEAAAKGEPLPEWLELIEAYCHSNRERLNRGAAEGEYRPLACYLRMRTRVGIPDDPLRLFDCEQVLKVAPDCLQAIDTMFTDDKLGTQRAASELGLKTHLTRWGEMLEGLEELPPYLEKLRTESKQPATSDHELYERARIFHGNLETVEPITPLRRAEPNAITLRAIGYLGDEWFALQVYRVIDFYFSSLAVPPNDSLEELQPLYVRHRLKPIFELMRRDPDQDRSGAWREENWNLNTVGLGLGFSVIPYFEQRLWGYWGLADWNVFGELISLADSYHSDFQINMDASRRLRAVSPHMLGTVRNSLKYDWDRSQPYVAAWEQSFIREPLVQEALGVGYQRDKNLEAAERCLKRRVAEVPDVAGLQKLASVYYDQKNYDLWLKTLETALQKPARGLEHTRIRDDIAHHYMRREEWDKAKPYALEAADSYAYSGLFTAVLYYEGIQDYKRAADYMRAAAARYPSTALRWLHWCVRTGRGPRRAAEQYVRDQGSNYRIDSLDQAGLLMVTEPREMGVRHLESIWNEHWRDKMFMPSYALLVALEYDANGDYPIRDELLQVVTALEPNELVVPHRGDREKLQRDVALADLIRQDLATSTPGTELAPLLDLVNHPDADGDQQSQFAFFAGKYLLNRGHPDAAIPLLRKATNNIESREIWRTLAALELRALDVPVKPGDVPRQPVE